MFSKVKFVRQSQFVSVLGTFRINFNNWNLYEPVPIKIQNIKKISLKSQSFGKDFEKTVFNKNNQFFVKFWLIVMGLELENSYLSPKRPTAINFK